MENNHLLIALQQYGLTEVAGTGSNPKILEMAKECGFKDYISDEISWCSLFLCWVMLKANKHSSGKLNARSWLDIGDIVLTPVLGDICILWRNKPESWEGHVGLFISENEISYYLLGGNEGNMVQIETFPKSRLLGFRRV